MKLLPGFLIILSIQTDSYKELNIKIFEIVSIFFLSYLLSRQTMVKCILSKNRMRNCKMNKHTCGYYFISGFLGLASAVTAIITNRPSLSPEKPVVQIRNSEYTQTTAASEIFYEKTQTVTLCSSESTAVKEIGIININTADISELIKIKGIGEKKAAKIIEFRNINGPFVTKEDLLKVPGIGQKTLDSIYNEINV